jgi:ribosomal protein S18 acetylase RimI-like enzyme
VPRLVTEAEYGAVGDLVVRAYEAAGMLGPEDAYRSVVTDTRTRAERAQVYVLDDDAGRLVATVTMSPYGSAYSQVARPGELEFRMLAVEPAAAGRGIGSSLVAFCAAQALARGDRALVLCVVDANRSAIRLYERLGFTREPERDLQVTPETYLCVFRLALPADG